MQVVLTKRACSLDLFDEKHARRDRPAQPGLTISLSAKSADKFKQQLSKQAAGVEAGNPQSRWIGTARPSLIHSVRSAPRLRAQSALVAPQKENQCQES
jgi:hypothetical protein